MGGSFSPLRSMQTFGQSQPDKTAVYAHRECRQTDTKCRQTDTLKGPRLNAIGLKNAGEPSIVMGIARGRMNGSTHPIDRDNGAERQWRVTVAFIESAIATSASLDALLGRLYRRDPDTLAHLHRVASLSVRIGEELGMADRALDDLERAALLHDVGRLVIPDPVGPAVGLLDASVSGHRADQVRVACEVVEDLPFLRPAADLLAASLECYDGSGYPYGLRGEEIPVGARVLHVADTLDALTAVCAALAYSSEAANAELVRLAGLRFDPDVVAAWLRCSDELPPSLVSWRSSAAGRMN